MEDDQKMDIDEEGAGEMLEQQGSDGQAEEEPSYRMVMRRYYCHLCQKDYNEMVPALQNIKCSGCGEEFIEIIEKKQKAGTASSTAVDDVDDDKKKVNEQYRIVFGPNGGVSGDGTTVIYNPAANRTDLYDRSTNNLYGAPNPSRIR